MKDSEGAFNCVFVPHSCWKRKWFILFVERFKVKSKWSSSTINHIRNASSLFSHLLPLFTKTWPSAIFSTVPRQPRFLECSHQIVSIAVSHSCTWWCATRKHTHVYTHTAYCMDWDETHLFASLNFLFPLGWEKNSWLLYRLNWKIFCLESVFFTDSTWPQRQLSWSFLTFLAELDCHTQSKRSMQSSRSWLILEPFSLWQPLPYAVSLFFSRALLLARSDSTSHSVISSIWLSVHSNTPPPGKVISGQLR